MTPTIEVIVSRQGQTKIETKGFVGASCREASQFIEAALGQRTSEELTAEFHIAAPASQVNHQRG